MYNTFWFWLVQKGRDVSNQDNCVSVTIHLGEQGSQIIHTWTQHFGTSRHPTENDTRSVFHDTSQRHNVAVDQSAFLLDIRDLHPIISIRIC